MTAGPIISLFVDHALNTDGFEHRRVKRPQVLKALPEC